MEGSNPPPAPDSTRSAEIRSLRADFMGFVAALQPMLAAYAPSQAAGPSAPPAAPTAGHPPTPTAAGTSSALKPNKPTKFDGRGNIKSWLDSMRTYLLTIGKLPPFSGTDAVVWASGFLFGTAQDWWIARKHQSGDAVAGGFTSFDGLAQFADSLTKHFADSYPEATADAKLTGMKLSQYKRGKQGKQGK